MKVDVYYNLHKKKLSIRSREKENYGKVIDHCDSVLLKDVSFIVNQSGRKRVLKEKKKNVHAFVRGFKIENLVKPQPLPCLKRIIYNPYLYNSFVDEKSGKSTRKAEYVHICDKSIWAYNIS